MSRKLILRNGLLFTSAFLPDKDQSCIEEVHLIVDTGADLTILSPTITDYLGYSARGDGLRRSVLDGAAGRSTGELSRNIPAAA